MAQSAGGQWCIGEEGELGIGEVLVACLDFRDVDVAEGVFVMSQHIALEGLVDEASQGLQAQGDGVGGEVPLVAHPVLPALDDVVGDVADAEVGMEEL